MDHQKERFPGLESQWREWSSSEPRIDEQRLRQNLLKRLPGERRPRVRLMWAAAAASLVALVIGVGTVHRRVTTLPVDGQGAALDPGPNVILVLREGNEPIYVLTEAPAVATKE